MGSAVLVMPRMDQSEEDQYFPDRRYEPQQLIVPKWVITSVISFLSFFIIHFGATVWWASKITSELKSTKEYIENRTFDRYTGTEARKDIEAIQFRFNRNEKLIQSLSDKIDEIQRNTRNK